MTRRRPSARDLLLVVYRRLPARHEGVQLLGDEQLLDFYLERTAFE
ncbi:hypothetical protein P3T36_002863 [Kitasatospora sp. MAP12-15]|nr:hypothetical protein [Kitasatospora sp. MAP12-44]MDH6114042.1 hypothetical protein [Kitasatospora sp. MAP12-44]